MPIYSPTEPAPPKTTVLEPEVPVSQSFETKTYPTPQITDIEGIPWLCNFYHQLLTNGESPQPFDPGLDPTLQQYLKITDFRISVTEDLSYSQDPGTQLSVLTGTGLLYPDTVAPHVGDMFTGHIEAGRVGIFTLTSVQSMGYYKKTVYQVEYRLYSEDVGVYQAPLDTRAVQFRYFDNRRLIAGYSPLISYDIANSERQYYNALRRLMDRLYNRFYSKRYETFILGDIVESFYDHYAVSFFNAVIPSSMRGSYPAPLEYSIGDEMDWLERPTIWSALLKQDVDILADIPRHYNARSTSETVAMNMYRSAANSGLDWTYYPDVWFNQPIDPDNAPYIYSHAFYDAAEGITEVEAGVRDCIAATGVSNAALSAIIADAETQTGIDGLRKLILVIGILKFKLVGA